LDGFAIVVLELRWRAVWAAPRGAVNDLAM